MGVCGFSQYFLWGNHQVLLIGIPLNGVIAKYYQNKLYSQFDYVPRGFCEGRITELAKKNRWKK